MVLFFTITLLISIVGISSLIGVKRWELATGGIVGARMRSGVGRFFHRAVMWAEHVLPRVVVAYIEEVVGRAQDVVHRTSAYLVLHAEQWLERTLQLVRHKTDARRGMGEVSVFLREVAEHKKKLIKTSRMRIKTQIK